VVCVNCECKALRARTRISAIQVSKINKINKELLNLLLHRSADAKVLVGIQRVLYYRNVIVCMIFLWDGKPWGLGFEFSAGTAI
jgi:hypothetical protein